VASLIARPLRGGQVLVERLVEGAGAELRHHPPSRLTLLARGEGAGQGGYCEPLDAGEGLSEEVRRVEGALREACEVLQLWRRLEGLRGLEDEALPSFPGPLSAVWEQLRAASEHGAVSFVELACLLLHSRET